MSERNEVHIGHGAVPDPTIIGNALPRLRPLSELARFKVADDDPDIRDWLVRDASGRTIGRVHDLIAEMDTRQVRYLDVAVDRGSGDERHVLIPIGLARLNDDVDIVSIAALTREQLLALPVFDHTTFTRDRELELIGQLQGLAGRAADTPDLYRHAVFAMTGFWGERQAPKAEVTYSVIAIAEADQPNDEP
jgi:photosynthetic reaction center H subunit